LKITQIARIHPFVIIMCVRDESYINRRYVKNGKKSKKKKSFQWSLKKEAWKKDESKSLKSRVFINHFATMMKHPNNTPFALDFSCHPFRLLFCAFFSSFFCFYLNRSLHFSLLFYFVLWKGLRLHPLLNFRLMCMKKKA
jgi:hypothetical protein